MTAEHKAEIEKIRARSSERAFEIIRVIMPRKVIELTQMLVVRTYLFVFSGLCRDAWNSQKSANLSKLSRIALLKGMMPSIYQ
mgnify:CR=1 FL=1